MFKLIPVLAGIATILGAAGLGWYHCLSREQQMQADRIAAEYALKLYQKALDELTRHEFEMVALFVKRHFGL